MDLRYESLSDLPAEPRLSALVDLLILVFSGQTHDELRADLTYQLARPAALLLLAFDNQRLIGCKLGYEYKPDQFYSWLGCVDPDYRGRGIAAELMRRQHDWCRQQNYRTIRTQTYNHWRAMLILNLRAGFDIVGTVQGKRGLTIVLEKVLGGTSPAF